MESFYFFKKFNRTNSWDYIVITIGAFLMAVAVVVYFDAIGIVSGGITGIGIILRKLVGIPIWLVNIALNLPLFIVGVRILGRSILFKTLYATAALSGFLAIVPKPDVLTGDRLADMVTGSVFMGTGIGMIILCSASSGGSDLLATIVNKKLRYVSIPKIMAAVDGVIVICGVGVFGIKNGVYSLFAVYLITKISDAVLEGVGKSKMIYVISDRCEELVEYISGELERGATYIDVRGAFSGRKRKMIMCVASAREMVKIKQKLYKIDENAICFMGDISEAFGEGFTKYRG